MKKYAYFSIGIWLLVYGQLSHANACDNAWDTWIENMYADMKFNYDDHSVKISQGKELELFRQYLSNAEVVVSDLNRLISLSSNQELLRKLRRIQDDYYTIADMGRLSYAIILAEKRNNTDLFFGAVKGIYKDRFKHLALPLLNRAAIEYRKYQIRETKIDEEMAARKRILDSYRSMFDSVSGRLKFEYIPCF